MELAILDKVFTNHIDAVTLREEVVIRLLEAHFAYQHYAGCQSYGQADYLRPVMLASFIQSFYC
jgi:hypothetical protein